MIELTIPGRGLKLGRFEVGRVLPSARRRMVGPFTLLDHLPVSDLPKGADDLDILPHPHIGLATVSYLFSGQIVHRDSIGSEAVLNPGEVAVMSAGRGITHSERFERARLVGDRLSMLQAWVALPDELEESEPGFVHTGAGDVPGWRDAGVEGKLLLGRAFGLAAPIPGYSPSFYASLRMDPGARAPVPDEYPERAIYIVSGAIEIEGQSYRAGEMLVIARGPASFRATEASEILLLGGEPVGERFMFWNFVSSSRERIQEAAADWQAGRMKLPDLDDREFIPLTQAYRMPANPLS